MYRYLIFYAICLCLTFLNSEQLIHDFLYCFFFLNPFGVKHVVVPLNYISELLDIFGMQNYRSSKEFPDMHSLIMHMYNPDKADLLVDHLGLHKALCVLMGWNYI